MKIKMKFKAAKAIDIGLPDSADDVIVLKVKREDWNDFSQLLGAARDNSADFSISSDEVGKVEHKFDELYNLHQS